MDEEYKPIKTAINQILNVDAYIKRRKHAKKYQKKETFISIINLLQQVTNRSDLLFADLKVDYSSYDESFLQIIDKLMLLTVGEKAYIVVSFYLWERINPDGSENVINDVNGVPIPLSTPNDLWSTIVKLNPSLEK